jgi:ribosomal protein S18 acetylase RimI-like enzyme
MEGRVRRAGIGDAADIARVGVAGWKQAHAGLLPAKVLACLSEKVREMQAAERIESPPSPDHRTWVVELGGEVRGYCLTGPTSDADDQITNTSEVYELYVHPDHQGIGLGRTLIVWVLDDLRDRGYLDVTLWAHPENRPARAFYEAAGFLLDGPPRDKSVQGHAIPHLRYRKRF